MVISAKGHLHPRRHKPHPNDLAMFILKFKQEDLEKIKTVKEILDKEYYRHYTQADLAQMACINEFALKKGFKQLTGKTLHQYVTWVRVEKAKDLLLNTDMPIKTIAGRIGLNKRNLTKSFIKLTKTTPYQWRRMQRNEVNDQYEI